MGYRGRLIVFCLIVGLFLSLSHPLYAINTGDELDGSQSGSGGDPGSGGNGDQITVETEIGPEFTDGDASQIQACSLSIFETKFPLDFVQPPTGNGQNDCPSLTMFGYTHEACFIVETFEKIEPGIIAVLFIVAIISL
jgi:hypothetical protein